MRNVDLPSGDGGLSVFKIEIWLIIRFERCPLISVRKTQLSQPVGKLDSVNNVMCSNRVMVGMTRFSYSVT